MVQNNKSISVVIPNYNGVDLLPSNINSLLIAINKAQTVFEIIVIDDASTDGSVAYLQSHYPDIIVLVNATNQGFSITANRGVQQAKHDLLFLLNNDVVLDADYFVGILAAMAGDEVFGVMGQIRSIDNVQTQDTAKFPAMGWLSIKGSVNYCLKNKRDISLLPSLFLSGANALIDRKKMLQLGGFCELFSPFYYEDTHVGIAAWRAGWSCLYAPDSVCFHPNSVTINKYNKPERIKIIVTKNKILLHYLHLSRLGFTVFFIKQLFVVLFGLMRLQSYRYKALVRFINQFRLVQSFKSKQADNTLLSLRQVRFKIINQLKGLDYEVF